MSLVPLPSQSGKDLKQRKEKTQKSTKKKQCCWFLPPSHPTHIPPIPTLPSAYRASTTILISIFDPCSHFPYPYSYFYFPYPCSHLKHPNSFSQPSICIHPPLDSYHSLSSSPRQYPCPHLHLLFIACAHALSLLIISSLAAIFVSVYHASYSPVTKNLFIILRYYFSQTLHCQKKIENLRERVGHLSYFCFSASTIR